MNINPKPDVIPDFIRTVSASGDLSKVVDKNNIANEMNKEFSNMGANLAEKLETTSAHFSDFLQGCLFLRLRKMIFQTAI